MMSSDFLGPSSQPLGTGLPELLNHEKPYFQNGLQLGTKKNKALRLTTTWMNGRRVRPKTMQRYNSTRRTFSERQNHTVRKPVTARDWV